MGCFVYTKTDDIFWKDVIRYKHPRFNITELHMFCALNPLQGSQETQNI